MNKALFEQHFGEPLLQTLTLSANGSNRQYWRLIGERHSCIAAYNSDVRENEAFFYYSQALKERGVRVPEIYAIAPDRQHYLQQDLGDTTLYSWLYDRRRQGVGFDKEALAIYKQVLSDLAYMQVKGADIDFSHAYPRASFDAQSICWDLQYFKYYFLKLAHVPFDEQLLENDFHVLTDFLLSADCRYLLYRDFQSRNIMLVDGTPFYIDYQGARQGAAQYDVASLLYSAKSDLPEPIRQELLAHYIKEFETHTLKHLHIGATRAPTSVHTLTHWRHEGADLSSNIGATRAPTIVHTLAPRGRRPQFTHYFYAYVLVRILQAMGAYGYRGWFERKAYFLQSIPLAINNLRNLLQDHPLPVELPHLMSVLQQMVERPWTPDEGQQAEGLTVTVGSFSYKKGLPEDPTGNGGGFIFDCRALPNPGRYPEYRAYTGRDLPVIQFLQSDPAVEDFLAHAQQLVAASIRNYQERHFSNLSVSFGCTGGQHRSVYCAERLARWISENFDCHVVVKHREQQK